MSTFNKHTHPESPLLHNAPKIGVLLVNLGTPDSPTYFALMRYLRAFLSDPRVVQIPKSLWLPILYGIILPFRSYASAKKYRRIWQTDSPLRLHGMALADHPTESWRSLI